MLAFLPAVRERRQLLFVPGWAPPKARRVDLRVCQGPPMCGLSGATGASGRTADLRVYQGPPMCGLSGAAGASGRTAVLRVCQGPPMCGLSGAAGASGRTADLRVCQGPPMCGYSAAIMVARVVALPLHALRSAWRRVSAWVARQLITGNRRVALLLTLVTAFISIAAVHVSQSWFSPGLLILPVLAGGLLLWPRALRILFVLIAIGLAYDVVEDKAGPGLVLTIVVTAAVALQLARTREKLGMLGLRGEAMLIELRDRIRAQGTLPELPEGWGSVSVLRPAGGSSFGGDFLVSSCDGKTLEVALVDVAGKGVDAGTRALLLSGAFGGLLGSVPQEEFLSTCNAYLRRGEMTEGFVTAVHLALDLTTGEYMVTSAGHPPAAHLDSSNGTWRITQARGIVLGVVADLRLVPEQGVLRPGDA